MAKKLMAEQWDEFARCVLPPDCSPIQRQEMRRAFYAGGESILFRVIQAFAPEAEPTEADLDLLSGVNQELIDFAAEVKAQGMTPKYWMDETSGKLAEAVNLYLTHPESLGPTGIGLLREYFRQWIDSPAWDLNPSPDEASLAKLNALRVSAPLIRTLSDINLWLRLAMHEGIDPL